MCIIKHEEDMRHNIEPDTAFQTTAPSDLSIWVTSSSLDRQKTVGRHREVLHVPRVDNFQSGTDVFQKDW